MNKKIKELKADCKPGGVLRIFDEDSAEIILGLIKEVNKYRRLIAVYERCAAKSRPFKSTPPKDWLASQLRRNRRRVGSSRKEP